MTFSPLTALFTAVALPLIYFVFKRTRDFLKTHLGLALDAAFWLLGRAFVHSLATHVSLKRYCRIKLSDSANKYLHVPGKVAKALETDRIFIPLDFETSSGTEEQESHGLLTSGNCVRVVGDPGSGKSSCIKQTFRDACRTGIHAGRRNHDVRLPVMIELKTFTPPPDVDSEEAAGRWALKQLRASVENVRAFETGKLFDSYLSGRGLLVLLDGLDEVAADAYPRTAAAIKGLVAYLGTQSDRNITILTMRSQFHQQIHSDFDDQFPVVFKIAAFKPTDIFQFLERWPFTTDRLKEVSRIYSDLTDRPTLREMCSNPLVLAMYVSNDQADDGESAPDTRTSFYNQVIEELLVARRSRQLRKTARSKLREQREEILGWLALGNLQDRTQAANSIDWDTAVHRITEVMECETREKAEDDLRHLAKDTGILSEEREGESLRFIHLTFCEFLAAKEAALGQKNGWRQLLHTHGNFNKSEAAQTRSRLNEVIPFAAALLPRSQRGDAVQAVAALNSTELLSRCFLETQVYSGVVWDSYVSRERRLLTQTDAADWDEAWRTRLHLFNVVLRDAAQWSELSGRPFSFRLEELFGDLVGRDRERLLSLFSAYALSDPAAALRLAEACGVDLTVEHPELIRRHCDFPPFLAVALQKTGIASDAAYRWSALLADAGLRGSTAALVMNSREAPAKLASEFHKVPRRKQWAPLHQEIWLADGGTRPRGQKGVSYYSAILTLALNRPGYRREDLPALKVLEKVPPPGTVTPGWIAVVLGVVIILGTGGIAISHLETWSPLAIFVLGLLGLSLSTWCITYPAVRRRHYSAAVNLRRAMPDRFWMTWREPWARESGMFRLRLELGRLLQSVQRRVYLRRVTVAIAMLRSLRMHDLMASRVVAKGDEERSLAEV